MDTLKMHIIQIIMDKSKAFVNFMTVAYGYTKMYLHSTYNGLIQKEKVGCHYTFNGNEYDC